MEHIVLGGVHGSANRAEETPSEASHEGRFCGRPNPVARRPELCPVSRESFSKPITIAGPLLLQRCLVSGVNRPLQAELRQPPDARGNG
jgi:hypothetical protein